jgi:flavin-dependent thymidylate synthase
MLESFVGQAPDGTQACHNDGNPLNNTLENLRWDTAQGNADDRVRDGATARLGCFTDRIVDVEYVGERMTYDLEVEGPWHNFSAGGLVVHNSVNEISGRYTELPTEFYVPEVPQIQVQAVKNRQGRGDDVLEDASDFRAEFASEGEAAMGLYRKRLEVGMARELARINLPVSTYTQAYWKIDLHNLFHFLELRLNPVAQWEFQQYARKISNIVALVCPIAWEAFVDYRLNAISFTAIELTLLAQMLEGGKGLVAHPKMTQTEEQEFLGKLANLKTRLPKPTQPKEQGKGNGRDQRQEQTDGRRQDISAGSEGKSTGSDGDEGDARERGDTGGEEEGDTQDPGDNSQPRPEGD